MEPGLEPAAQLAAGLVDRLAAEPLLQHSGQLVAELAAGPAPGPAAAAAAARLVVWPVLLLAAERPDPELVAGLAGLAGHCSRSR